MTNQTTQSVRHTTTVPVELSGLFLEHTAQEQKNHFKTPACCCHGQVYCSSRDNLLTL
jgi:hypothetical protein